MKNVELKDLLKPDESRPVRLTFIKDGVSPKGSPFSSFDVEMLDNFQRCIHFVNEYDFKNCPQLTRQGGNFSATLQISKTGYKNVILTPLAHSPAQAPAPIQAPAFAQAPIAQAPTFAPVAPTPTPVTQVQAPIAQAPVAQAPVAQATVAQVQAQSQAPIAQATVAQSQTPAQGQDKRTVDDYINIMSHIIKALKEYKPLLADGFAASVNTVFIQACQKNAQLDTDKQEQVDDKLPF